MPMTRKKVDADSPRPVPRWVEGHHTLKAAFHSADSYGLLFVLLVPEQANETHLQILSELAQMFSDRDFRQQLSTEPDAQSLHRVFSIWQPHAPDQRRATA